MDLKEGNIYPFLYISDIKNKDHNISMKLKDPNGIFHLLEKEKFKTFDFSIGQEISMRIDKINCSGKMYVEPVHPYYRVGKIYEFLIDTIMNGEEQLIIVRDAFDQKITLPFSKELSKYHVGETIKCKINKIKEAKFFLFPVDHFNDYSDFETGQSYAFMVSGIEHYGGGQDQYILENNKRNRFRIRMKYFKNYPFKVGDQIECTFFIDDKTMYLEPTHPHYQVGKIYPFRILREMDYEDYKGEQKSVYILENFFGKEIYIEKHLLDIEGQDTQFVNCKVNKIFKGRLEVDQV